MILDLDPDSIPGRVSAQHDFGIGSRELEGVLQQVADCGEQHFPVDIERQARVDIADRQDARSRLRFERGGYSDIGDEIGERDQVASRKYPRCYAHVGQGTIYETAHPDQGTIQHGSRRAGRPNAAGFDRCNGKRRDVEMISQLVREKSQPFVQGLYASVLYQRIPLKSVFGHRIGDTIVETAVESSKLVYSDRSATFECEIGDCLTQIAVVVNNLLNCEPLSGQLPPVQRRSCTYLGRGWPAPTGPETLRLRRGSDVCSTRSVLIN
jgi:hypothetical protein